MEINPGVITSYTEMLDNAKASLKTAKTTTEKEMWKKVITEDEYGLEKAKQPYLLTWDWEHKYPESTDSAITRALRYYLREAATVDFNAALTQRGKLKVFSNPVYERKSAFWKAIFRAGKEVNDETVVFVNAWLKEVIHVSTESYKIPEERKNEVKTAAPVASTQKEKPAEKTEKTEMTEKTEKKAGGLLKKIKKVLD